MKVIVSILLIIQLNLFSIEKIENYKSYNKSIVYKNQKLTILRSFKKENNSYYLVVNENTLKTKIIKAELLKDKKEIGKHKSRYFQILSRYKKSPFLLQDYGVTNLDTNKVYLTVDMCPSLKNRYERKFFYALSDSYFIPEIVVFISGKWILKHEKDFLELLLLQKNKKLNIVWGNHTFSHPYKPMFPLSKNFLLSKGINIENEILSLEKLLLSYGITPSILFRFPGLVSNKKTSLAINRLGLIPLGSNAWLAKNEKVKKGSVILVHGNGNEVLGINIFNNLMNQKSFNFGSLIDDLK